MQAMPLCGASATSMPARTLQLDIAMTSGLPFDDYRQLLRTLRGPDAVARDRAEARSAALSTQGPALGRLGEFAVWLATWTGRDPQVLRPLVAVFAGTHAVARRLGGGPDGTAAQVEHAAAGGAAINPICASNDLGLKIFDLALHLPVADISAAPALDERGCAATMAFGMEAVAGGIDLLCLASMGEGGTVSAAALMMALHGGTAEDWVGFVGMPSQRAAAIAIVQQALALHGAHLADPLEALRRLGGREIAAMAGAILAARSEGVPVILDGYAGVAAAAVLKAVEPTAIDHCVLAHLSSEPGLARAATVLDLRPVLDLGIGDGEGVGAGLAACIVRNAAAIHSGMALREPASG